MKNEVNINVDMLNWAISRAGFELQEFAAKFPRVLDWIGGNKKPTFKQLEAFSHRLHVPFGYFFLDKPPLEPLPLPFFRTGTDKPSDVSLNVYDTILLIQRRQEWLVQYLKDNGAESIPFVGKFDVNSDYKEVVASIRETLNIEPDWARQFSRIEDSVNFITERIEETGIIVSFNSVVENNTSRPINVDECRGFVLVDSIAPFMFINAADGKAAQLFTIVHELAHVWTGQSAGFDFRQLQPADVPIEILCDKVAAEFLVPEVSFISAWRETPDIATLARRFKVSQIVIARRALDLNRITRDAFFQFYNEYKQQLRERKERQTGGGDFYVTQKKRLSVTFVTRVDQAVRENKLLYRDAYRMTGLKGDTFQYFINNKLY